MQRRPLTATYRLQFSSMFTFRDALTLVPYLDTLGISHVYASPLFAASPGSLHCYDVIDHSRFNPEIGDYEEFQALVGALHKRGMGLIMDIVPNHIGVGSDNRWWMDVLEKGPLSEYSDFFDIDWDPVKPELKNKVLLPFLPARYGELIENGGIGVTWFREEGKLYVQAPGWERLPASAPSLLYLKETFGSDVSALARSDDEESAGELESILQKLNSDRELLHEFLEKQFYRLSFWQVAADEINYRRFFDINQLAGLRIEREYVFRETHRFLTKLVEEGMVDGVRIDHIDGLFDPEGYLDKLAEIGERAPGPFYVFVEKILAPFEWVPETWKISGTTGYEFARLVGQVIVDPVSEKQMDRLYRRFVNQKSEFEDMIYRAKRLIMNNMMTGELSVLGHILNRISEKNWWSRDYTLNSLRQALLSVTAAFPVYRTYIRDRKVGKRDRGYIEWAVKRARRLSPAAETTVFDFLQTVLVNEPQYKVSDAERDEMLRFTMKFQQYTGPVMAKGVEDTVFYTYNRLTCLNDVGFDPEQYGISISAFHKSNEERGGRYPVGMLNTSTHDSKRSEDVRARIALLSELGGEWQNRVFRWSRMNRYRKYFTEDGPAPSRNDEYLFYQTMFGYWDAAITTEEQLSDFRERMKRFMLKAVREGKTHSSWINPNTEYESGLMKFIDKCLEKLALNPFLVNFREFWYTSIAGGYQNSLAQVALKLTSPGVPDLYQGSELWNLQLVDPDNREPIDYDERIWLLNEVIAALRSCSSREERLNFLDGLIQNPHDNRIKLFITTRILCHRRKFPGLYAGGEYLPIETEGDHSGRVVSFMRRDQQSGLFVIVVVPIRTVPLISYRNPFPVGNVWGDTVLCLPENVEGAEREVFNIFTGEKVQVDPGARLELRQLFAHFPIAVISEI